LIVMTKNSAARKDRRAEATENIFTTASSSFLGDRLQRLIYCCYDGAEINGDGGLTNDLK